MLDRIENVDLREVLREIARNNTFFHLETDINIGFDQMEHAAKLDDPTETTLIWVSYPGGIDCYSEREVFHKDTRDYNGVIYHGTECQSERRLAYAVEVTALLDGEKLYGNLYQIDINKYADHVKQNALVSDTKRLFLKDPPIFGKSQITMPKSEFNERYPRGLPKMTHYRAEPRDPAALDALLINAHKDREASTQPCSQYSHTSKLYNERREFYSSEIMRSIDKLEGANSPDERSFTVPLNSYIANAFGPEQLSQLLDELPYINAMFAVQKGQNDMRVVVPYDEVLQHRRDQAQYEKLLNIVDSLEVGQRYHDPKGYVVQEADEGFDEEDGEYYSFDEIRIHDIEIEGMDGDMIDTTLGEIKKTAFASFILDGSYTLIEKAGPERGEDDLPARLEKAAAHIIETSSQETSGGNWITHPGDVPADILSPDEYMANIQAIADIMLGYEAVAEAVVDASDGSIDTMMYLDYCPNIDDSEIEEVYDNPANRKVVDPLTTKPDSPKPSILGQLAAAQKEAAAMQSTGAPIKHKGMEI